MNLTPWQALARGAEAFYGFAVAFLGSLVTVLVGETGFGDVTDGQWTAATLVGLIAAGGVLGLRSGTHRANERAAVLEVERREVTRELNAERATSRAATAELERRDLASARG